MNEIKLNSETTLSREDLKTIVSMIPHGARILDLGCGGGRLLKVLATLKGARVQGVEMDQTKVLECAARGVPVIHANLDDGLTDFPDNSFDFVILSQTFQAVHRPDLLLVEMLRVAKTGIISYLNIGHWNARVQLLCGRMPVTKTLPLHWYNTPNIHLGTISDFRELCRSRGISIKKEIPIAVSGSRLAGLAADLWPNAFATTSVFIIER